MIIPLKNQAVVQYSQGRLGNFGLQQARKVMLKGDKSPGECFPTKQVKTNPSRVGKKSKKRLKKALFHAKITF